MIEKIKTADRQPDQTPPKKLRAVSYRQLYQTGSDHAARSVKFNNVQCRMKNNYSQVQQQNGLGIPQDVLGPDSYGTPSHVNEEPLHYDAALRNVLQMLKDNRETECKVIQLAPSQQPKHINLFDSPFRRSKKQYLSAYLSQVMGQLRQKVKSIKCEMQHQQYSFMEYANKLQEALYSQSPVIFVQHSICESVQLENDQLIKTMKYEGEHKAVIDQLNQKIQTQKQNILELELKCTEIDARHKLTCLKLENENKLLRMELDEVTKKAPKAKTESDDKRKANKVDRSQEYYQQLKNKEEEVISLRQELTDKCTAIQILIATIRDLESSVKDYPSRSPSMILDKQEDIQSLNTRIQQLEQLLQQNHQQYTKLESESFAIYQQNFYLKQKIDSMQTEVEQRLTEQRKQLNREWKHKLTVLEKENKHLSDYISDINAGTVLYSPRGNSQVNHVRKQQSSYSKTPQYNSHKSGKQKQFNNVHSRGESQTYESVPLDTANFRGNKKPTRKQYQYQIEEKVSSSSPKNYHHLRTQMNQKQKLQERSVSNRDLMYQTKYMKEPTFDIPYSSYTLPKDPVQFYKTSPTNFYSSSSDNGQRNQYHIDIKSKEYESKIASPIVKQPNARKNSVRPPAQTDFQRKDSIEGRGRTQLSSLQIQLNNLTKELRSEIANVPRRAR